MIQWRDESYGDTYIRHSCFIRDLGIVVIEWNHGKSEWLVTCYGFHFSVALSRYGQNDLEHAKLQALSSILIRLEDATRYVNEAIES